MGNEKDLDLKRLMTAIFDEDLDLDDEEEEEEPQLGPFAQKVSAAIDAAVRSLRSEGMLEVDEGSIDVLVAEVTEAGLEANSPKQLMKRVIKTLLASEHVEEIYGTDEMIAQSLERFFG